MIMARNGINRGQTSSIEISDSSAKYDIDMSAVKFKKGSIKLADLLFKPGSLASDVPSLVIVHLGGGVKGRPQAFRLND
jgi:hypothetical protein